MRFWNERRVQFRIGGCFYLEVSVISLSRGEGPTYKLVLDEKVSLVFIDKVSGGKITYFVFNVNPYQHVILS